MEWRPIKTAPMDGTPIIAVEGDEVAVVARDGRGWYAPIYDMAGLNNPTHWMPIPDLPSNLPGIRVEDLKVEG